MRNLLLFAVSIFVLVSCTDKPKGDSVVTSSTINTVTQLFSFSETTAEDLCDTNGIVPSDCSGGSLYLTEKGHVVYEFFCCCGDTTTYAMGSYLMNDTSITCNFERNYVFADPSMMMETESVPTDPNNGKLVNIKPWKIELKKINCEKYAYTFDEVDKAKTYTYVVRPVTNKNDDLFYEKFEKIKAFSDL